MKRAYAVQRTACNITRELVECLPIKGTPFHSSWSLNNRSCERLGSVCH